MAEPELRDKVAIVTGGSRGIGAAIAQRLALAGASVAVAARTEEASDSPLEGTIHETVASLRSSGAKAIAVRTDLSKPEDRRQLLETTERELGPVDILVNNAAVTYFLPVGEFPEKRFRLMFEVQVRAPFELAQLVLPGMRERKRGWILNISSIAARHPQGPPFPSWGRGGTVYGMCKAAIERFSTGLAAEVYEDGVAVNALSPTKVVPTPGVVFHRLIPPEADLDAVAEQPDVIAEAAFALCSGDPKSLTGRIAYSQQILEEFGLTATPLE